MSKKQLPPPDGHNLDEALRRRLDRDRPSDTWSDTDRTSATDRTSRTDRTGATKPPATDAVRRSWYMPKASADALSDAIDDLHFATRKPKAEVIAALVDVALRHQEEARKQLGTKERRRAVS